MKKNKKNYKNNKNNNFNFINLILIILVVIIIYLLCQRIYKYFFIQKNIELFTSDSNDINRQLPSAKIIGTDFDPKIIEMKYQTSVLAKNGKIYVLHLGLTKFSRLTQRRMK